MHKVEFDEFEKLITPILKGNRHAVSLCLSLFEVAQVWDDLIDEREQVTDRHVHDAFTLLIHKIPSNPFYQININELAPVIMSSVNQWHAANILDQGSETDKDKSYVLRAGFYNIVLHCAMLVGGYHWAQSVSADIWRMYGETRDNFLEVSDA